MMFYEFFQFFVKDEQLFICERKLIRKRSYAVYDVTDCRLIVITFISKFVFELIIQNGGGNMVPASHVVEEMSRHFQREIFIILSLEIQATNCFYKIK